MSCDNISNVNTLYCLLPLPHVLAHKGCSHLHDFTTPNPESLVLTDHTYNTTTEEALLVACQTAHLFI